VRRLVLLAVAIAALAAAPTAGAAEPEWHSEQPVAEGIGVPVAIGPVGDIAFWAPNRGALITAGNRGMPAGVYAYDGSGWYLYSTVCGGHGGSIAWVGPDEFWTVSDYAEPQEGTLPSDSEWSRTLCHFKGGEVVASYAEPRSALDAYAQMNAAACSGPADCWFAGERLPESAANQGAFHLHWDGGALTAFPSPTTVEPESANLAGSVQDLAFYQGSLFESSTEAPFVHAVAAADPARFFAVELPATSGGPVELATDTEQQQLWAASQNGTVLLRAAASFETVPYEGELFLERGLGTILALAAEPGTQTAWLGSGLVHGEVRRIAPNGALGPIVQLPQPAEELGDKGPVDQIACPAAGQCWLATSQGWLFHLGGPLPQNTDPVMHRLITARPPDDSSRTFVPAGVPEDDSGETEPKAFAEPPLGEKFPSTPKPRALVAKVHQRLIHKTVLELSFELRAKAYVRLVAKRRKAVVAKTPRRTLGKGPHVIHLRLDPERWPTSLDFQVHAAGKGGK
jgi:hypothetical protein